MASFYPYPPGYGHFPQPPMSPMQTSQQIQSPGSFQQPHVPMPAATKGGVNVPGMLPIEESYIDNILRLNKGKLVHIYTTFEHNKEWNAKVFNGVIEAAGRDHIILNEPETGRRVLIPMLYVDYVIFDEPIEYEYPFGSGPLASSPPR